MNTLPLPSARRHRRNSNAAKRIAIFFAAAATVVFSLPRPASDRDVSGYANCVTRTNQPRVCASAPYLVLHLFRSLDNNAVPRL